MRVVTYSEAARLAGVTRQRVNEMRVLNKDGIKEYPFFIFNPSTGKPGIDVDSSSWLEYQSLNDIRRVKRKGISDTRKVTQETPAGESLLNMDTFANSIFNVLVNKYKINPATAKQILVDVGEEYNKASASV